MSNRVSKTMATEAAEQLAIKAFGEKQKQAEEDFLALGLLLYKKYTPKPVRDCYQEYKEVYDGKNWLCFLSENGSSSDLIMVGYKFRFPSIVPIILDKEDGKRLNDAKKKKNEIDKAKRNYTNEVTTALFNLRTEKNVREEFPEALPYLNFSSCTALVPNIDKLRQILK